MHLAKTNFIYVKVKFNTKERPKKMKSDQCILKRDCLSLSNAKRMLLTLSFASAFKVIAHLFVSDEDD